ncbi:MAG: phosphate acyltransferase PlsX [Gammaproteobacteria bacterium]
MGDITIALDAMGGDYGAKIVVPAAIAAVQQHAHVKIYLVGKQEVLAEHLSGVASEYKDRLIIHHASQTVAMDELPSSALRTKKDSSMRVAINLVKERKAQAVVSAGNTGALMATARFVLKTLPGIDRPALISELPTLVNRTRVLDLGANVDSYAEHLFQFAVMGSVLVAAEDNIDSPTVGLLNIGAEEIKGNEQVKHAAQLLTESNAVNYIGYVEGNELLKGKVDIIVCDGFIGNIALKTLEGSAKVLSRIIRETFQQTIFSRMIGLLSFSVLKRLRKRMDPAQYNGASLLGLNGIVIKSHGGANVLGFTAAINEAVVEAQKDVPNLIGERVSVLLQEGLLT